MTRLRPYLPLLLIAVAAFAIRLGAIYVLRPTCEPGGRTGITGECYPLFGDTHYVTVQAEYLSKGNGFVDSSAIVFGKAGPEQPGAAHPPMFTVFLAVLYKLGFDSVGWWRAATAVVGSIGVGLVGLAAWRLAGDRGHTTGRRSRAVGMTAAGIAAVNPLLWSRDADLLVESLVIPLVCLFVLAALRLWRRPTWTNAGLLGAALGISWLTRAELVLWLPCLIPLFYALRGKGSGSSDGSDDAPTSDPSEEWPAADGSTPSVATPTEAVSTRLPLGRRVGLLAVTGAVAATLMAPWVLYNHGRFQNPVYISTNLGMAVMLGSCDSTYFGEHFGYWTFDCVDPVDTSKVRDDSEAERMLSSAARSYVGDHTGRAPVTALARAGRFWGLYQPVDTVGRWDRQEGMGTLAARTGWLTLLVLVPFAVAGGWQLRTRRIPISPLLAPIIVATVAATLLIPIPRFRVAADVTIVILATFGIDAAWQRFAGVTRRPPKPRRPGAG